MHRGSRPSARHVPELLLHQVAGNTGLREVAAEVNRNQKEVVAVVPSAMAGEKEDANVAACHLGFQPL